MEKGRLSLRYGWQALIPQKDFWVLNARDNASWIEEANLEINEHGGR